MFFNLFIALCAGGIAVGLALKIMEFVGSELTTLGGGVIFFIGAICGYNLAADVTSDSYHSESSDSYNVNFRGKPSRTGACYTHDWCHHFTPMSDHAATCDNCECDISNHHSY